MTTDSLGDRMKGYELATRACLPRRLPVIVRVDGKAFHTYTRNLASPFDHAFIDAMDRVAVRLCENMDGAAVAYVQSDEISILMHGYRRHESQPWFDNEIQKIVSVSASLAAGAMTQLSAGLFGDIRPAAFDARAFVLPEAEVCNYFVWRQQDATRNSIQMLGRSLYSHRECNGKNTSELQEMCFQRGHNWNDLAVHLRRGRCVVRETYQKDEVTRSRWVADREPPIFTKDRSYIERHLAHRPDGESP
jgi:tRNA(His) guanylyltransferase